MPYQVGCRVRLSSDSRWQPQSTHNGKEYFGTIIEVKNLILPYRVQWDFIELVSDKRMAINSYDKEDLIPFLPSTNEAAVYLLKEEEAL